MNFSVDRPFETNIALDGCAAPSALKSFVYTGGPQGMSPGDARIDGTSIKAKLPPSSLTVFELSTP